MGKPSVDAGLKPRVVLSVPHTGTRFLRSRLQCLSKHTFIEDDRLAMDLVGVVIASPLREPAAVWQSWVRRMGTGHEVPLNLFDKSWERLAHLDEQYDIIYVPLDHPYRDAQIQEVERALGEAIEPEWGIKEGHIPEQDMRACVGYEDRTVDRDLNWIYELPMVKRFYDRPGAS